MEQPVQTFEDAVVDTLMIKCRRALEQTGFKRLVMAGGVSANRTLRAKLAEMMQKRGGEVFYARPEFCTDNGAMIAYAGMVRLKMMPIQSFRRRGPYKFKSCGCIGIKLFMPCRPESPKKGSTSGIFLSIILRLPSTPSIIEEAKYAFLSNNWRSPNVRG